MQKILFKTLLIAAILSPSVVLASNQSQQAAAKALSSCAGYGGRCTENSDCCSNKCSGYSWPGNCY